MKEVRRWEKKTLGRATRVLLWLMGLLLCAALLIWLKPFGGRSPLVPQVSSEPSTAKLLFSASDEELLSFTIHPRGGKSYTIRRGEDGYSLQSDPAFPLNPSMIQNMVDAILYLQVSDTLTDLRGETEHLHDYGLEETALRVDAKLTDNRTLSFTIGDRAPFEAPRDYLMMAGDSHLYAIPSDVREALDHRIKLLHTVPAINFAPELLDRLLIAGADSTLDLRRVDAGLWEIREPSVYPADKAAIDRLLSQVSQMRLAAYEADSNAADLAEYGLAAPRLQVEMHLPASTITAYPENESEPIQTQVAAQTLRFAIGDPIEHIGFYCLYNDVVYRASDLSMGFMLDNQFMSYAAAQAFDIPLSAVSELTIETSGRRALYEISLVEQVLPNNELARDEAGNILHNYLVMRDGIEIDPTQLVSAYARLMALGSKGRLPEGYAAQGEALLSVGLRFAGGLSRTVSFYPYDALNAAMGVNGRFVHYVGLDKLAFAMEVIEEIGAAMTPPPMQTSP